MLNHDQREKAFQFFLEFNNSRDYAKIRRMDYEPDEFSIEFLVNVSEVSLGDVIDALRSHAHTNMMPFQIKPQTQHLIAIYLDSV